MTSAEGNAEVERLQKELAGALALVERAKQFMDKNHPSFGKGMDETDWDCMLADLMSPPSAALEAWFERVKDEVERACVWEMVDEESTKAESDRAYNQAIRDCIHAIRSLTLKDLDGGEEQGAERG
jgi:hypothetical protein